MGARSSLRLRRHLTVGGSAGTAFVALMLVTERSRDTWGGANPKAAGTLWQFNVSTGTVALGLLVTSLMIGPIRRLTGRSATLNNPWRRATGIWAAVFAACHLTGGLAIHTSGWNLWVPFSSVIPPLAQRRFDEFTIGYWTGLLAALALVPLVVTSRDGAIRQLGRLRWRRLHRVLGWSVFWIIAVHAASLQLGENRDPLHMLLTASVFAAALVVRLASWTRSRLTRSV